MYLVWTTTSTRAQAEALAEGMLAEGLSPCVQLDGPIQSLYRWGGMTERSQEFRLLIKCLPQNLDRLKNWVRARHPYDTPEFVAIQADRVDEKYLNWACESSRSDPS